MTAGQVRQSEAFAAWSLDAQLPKVRCPVLSLHGEQDEFGSPAHPRRITDLVAGPSIQRLLQGCGHVPHREQPTIVLEAIGQFLA
ncbi:alpha/beta fold hydrolase [Pseudomonas guariconensis]|uniref:alpha/beta fold hydrolase n=1 Tax=Pseudomonas guariconensis TaxID=1288410 RepID=UPI0018A90F5F|nr:alpha/beta hydrolase [Pseudomonas guariconensis]MBF8757997.1 alpha/beta hydrolase [Pseudomonas guariconensis]